MKIEEIENEIAEEFSFFDEWVDKYEYIIELGRKLEPIPEETRVEENMVSGCQSKVWLIAEMKDETIEFKADSDSTIVKGLIALLLRVLSNQKPEDITNAKLGFIEKIGLTQHLAQTRANGLFAMIKQIKIYAMAFQIQHQKV